MAEGEDALIDVAMAAGHALDDLDRNESVFLLSLQRLVRGQRRTLPRPDRVSTKEPERALTITHVICFLGLGLGELTII